MEDYLKNGKSHRYPTFQGWLQKEWIQLSFYLSLLRHWQRYGTSDCHSTEWSHRKTLSSACSNMVFGEERPCVPSLLPTGDSWSEAIDARHSAGVIFVNLRKAFDKVPYGCFLLKFQVIDVDNALLCQIADFLYDHSSSVRVAESFLWWPAAASLVPQGLIFGPQLFLLYISDLPSAIS